MMEPTTFENAIRLQFDTLVKRVIDTTVKDYDRHMKFLSDHEKSFCELPEIKVNSFAIQDDYEMDVTVFDVYGMEARVSGDELCKALKRLPEKKRNNLLMFYFLDMSDTEIAELQKISRAGAFKNRQNALNKMRELLQKIASAVDSNEKAIEKLLQFYDPYISKASMRPLFDSYGNVYFAIDMELKGLIREAIMLMIPNFEVEIK